MREPSKKEQVARTEEEVLAIRFGLTPSDVHNMLEVARRLPDPAMCPQFWLGLQSWGALRARKLLRAATRGNESERWTAFGRFEESCCLMESLRELLSMIEPRPVGEQI